MKRITWLDPAAPPTQFPPVELALEQPAGLLAAGGDLSPARLLAAYQRGIFPWYSVGEPILWWCPDPREVLWPARLHTSRSLQRTLRRAIFTVTENQAFARVMQECARSRGPDVGTWITPAMQEGYYRLHALGHAHSIEVWRDGELVGGVYGVRCGTVFGGESMFSYQPDASKVALAWLAAHAADRNIQLIDCQMPSAHLRSLGSEALPRGEFLQILRSGLQIPA
jgi:leucyl/phenylalanyl-tRNA---protein transferase